MWERRGKLVYTITTAYYDLQVGSNANTTESYKKREKEEKKRKESKQKTWKY